MKSDLQILKEARDILYRSYIKWRTSDDQGGYCAQGAINMARFGDPDDFSSAWNQLPMVSMVERAANRLYPELSGATAIRPDGRMDKFDFCPIVYVNNQLGKKAVLAVFDDAIQHEELRLLCEDEAAKISSTGGQPEPELCHK